MIIFSRSISLCLSALLLASCTPFAIGAGALTGSAAAKEGGLSGAVSDAKIQAQINDLWFKYSTEAFGKLDMTVKNARVLLTGVVQNPNHRVEAVRLAWQPEGVEQVINEIKIAESEGVRGYARDAWVATRLRYALVRAPQVQSLNYTIDTVQGSVYLMGIAQSQAELDKALELARTIPNVKQVVSYVRVKAETASGASAGTP